MQIYSTLSRKKEHFTPIEPNHVRMYVCGVTVYDYCHLGHARSEVAFDVIRRYLLNKGYRVSFVRNITDIDDKIIKRANENNESVSSLTARMIDAMHEDYAALGILLPDVEPRATASVKKMQSLIQTLINKGYAYVAKNGSVYYRVRQFEGYGKLSGKVIEELKSGARVEADEVKEDPLDFVLWKGAKPREPFWSSPWGNGRPGWHIECSAMCLHTLGETFDIHGGGPDLKFPHHENEIAQSEAANGKQLAKIWMHAGALRINDEKMSKSLGNFFTVRDALKTYTPEAVRYFLISSHYRSHINYSEECLKEANIRLERLYNGLKGMNLSDVSMAEDTIYKDRFYAAMDDDFNTPEALAVLFDLVREINTKRQKNDEEAKPLAALLLSLGEVLGILQDNPESFLHSGSSVDKNWVESMIEARNKAKQLKDYAKADHIRELLSEKGIQLLDSRAGTTWKVERK